MIIHCILRKTVRRKKIYRNSSISVILLRVTKSQSKSIPLNNNRVLSDNAIVIYGMQLGQLCMQKRMVVVLPPHNARKGTVLYLLQFESAQNHTLRETIKNPFQYLQIQIKTASVDFIVFYIIPEFASSIVFEKGSRLESNGTVPICHLQLNCIILQTSHFFKTS